MKNLLPVFIIILVTSCAETTELKKIEPSEILYGVDFTSFAEQGFLFTPEKYSGPYLSIGLIDYEVFPGAEYKPIGKSLEYYQGQKTYTLYDWIPDPISIQTVLPKIYKICVDMGANGLVNFKFEKISKSIDYISNPAILFGYRVSGFAIKREDN